MLLLRGGVFSQPGIYRNAPAGGVTGPGVRTAGGRDM
jgi:hypothetical protein